MISALRCTAVALLVTVIASSLGAFSFAADSVVWTRFRGVVKGLDYRQQFVTLQMKDGDIIGVHVTSDITILDGKDEKALKDVRLDDKITLENTPKAQAYEDTPKFEDRK